MTRTWRSTTTGVSTTTYCFVSAERCGCWAASNAGTRPMQHAAAAIVLGRFTQPSQVRNRRTRQERAEEQYASTRPAATFVPRDSYSRYHNETTVAGDSVAHYVGASPRGAGPRLDNARRTRERAGRAGIRGFGAPSHGGLHETDGDSGDLRWDRLCDRAAGHDGPEDYGRRPHGRTRRSRAAGDARRVPVHADAWRMVRPGACRSALGDH